MMGYEQVICPKCSKKTEIIDTQKYETVVWRRRRCEDNHRFNTHETVIENEPKKIRKQPEPKPKVKAEVATLPIRNTRKQIQDLRDYLESKREDTDG